MTKDEIETILENHQHWLNEDCDGWRNMRANFSGADMSDLDLTGKNFSFAIMHDANLHGSKLQHTYMFRVDLNGADLSDTDLSQAYLNFTDLRQANLQNAILCDTSLRCAYLNEVNLVNAKLTSASMYGADLSNANLKNAILRDANMRETDLFKANLQNANLTGADLYNANLCYSDLCNAILYTASLQRADLRYANLRNVDLSCTNLHGSILNKTKNIPFIPYVCPESGSFIGYKKAGTQIIELEIPSDAKRLSATNRKCRCDKAKVLGIYDYNHNKLDIQSVCSDRDKNFIYTVGKIVKVDNFDEDRWNECSAGIHFFINFQEAVDY